MLRAGSRHYGCMSVIMAEARVLHDGMQAANAASYKDIIIKGDNLIIIKVVLGLTSIPWKILNVIRDVRFLLDQTTQVEVRHIFREANKAADWLSKYGHIHQIIIEDSSSLRR